MLINFKFGKRFVNIFSFENTFVFTHLHLLQCQCWSPTTMCLPAQQTRRHWTLLCDFDRSHQRQRRWRLSPCWGPSRGGSRVGPYLPPGISLVRMSATESASQKGTKAGTETRPGDLERERVVRYSYLWLTLLSPQISQILKWKGKFCKILFTLVLKRLQFCYYLDLSLRHLCWLFYHQVLSNLVGTSWVCSEKENYAIVLLQDTTILSSYLTFIILGGRVLSLPLPFSRLRWNCKSSSLFSWSTTCGKFSENSSVLTAVVPSLYCTSVIELGLETREALWVWEVKLGKTCVLAILISQLCHNAHASWRWIWLLQNG